MLLYPLPFPRPGLLLGGSPLSGWVLCPIQGLPAPQPVAGQSSSFVCLLQLAELIGSGSTAVRRDPTEGRTWEGPSGGVGVTKLGPMVTGIYSLPNRQGLGVAGWRVPLETESWELGDLRDAMGAVLWGPHWVSTKPWSGCQG